MNRLFEQIKTEYSRSQNKVGFLNDIRNYLNELSPTNKHPVDYVRWVPIEKVQANQYNPNSVARNELKLLHTSIDHDGYTQPVVTIYDSESDKYIIVDGFHRYFVMKSHPDIAQSTGNHLPIVVIRKDINDRMASTIRHNRARGKHAISGMSNIVFRMLDNGWKDADICNELGMEVDELVRLKHITGFSKLFKDVEYKRAWESDRQIRYKKDVEKEATS
jgi:ParB-like chromosome segregation protein Spo0J